MRKSKFLSSRISDIHSEPKQPPISKGKLSKDDEDDEEARRIFQRIKREAQALGISGLGEKERRAVETQTVHQLGARPQKRQRVPMAIGVGMTKKSEERDAKRREVAIAEGMTPAPKKRKQEERPRDRGLEGTDDMFKNGVLYVKKTEQKAEPKDDLQGKKRNKRFGKGGSKKGKKKSKNKGKKQQKRR